MISVFPQAHLAGRSEFWRIQLRIGLGAVAGFARIQHSSAASHRVVGINQRSSWIRQNSAFEREARSACGVEQFAELICRLVFSRPPQPEG
jgi:hypothetical protein